MASSAQKQQQHLPNMYGGATAAPPPTPSTQTNHLSTSDDADALSRLLHRLPPRLSLPSRVSPLATSPPPTISLSDQTNPAFLNILLSSSEQGFFQLTDHSIPSHLASSAESDSVALFELPREDKDSCFPKSWPLGFKGADEDEDGDGLSESFCLDSSCSTESIELSLTSLREFTQDMEKLGLKIVELLSTAVGFKNPIGEDPNRFCSFMWVSEGLSGNEPSMTGGFYPYIVGLQYQRRSQKYSLLADSCWVSVLPHVDSVMVTIGDVAQVWSNGKLKKVRGRPVACLGSDGGKNSSCISMTLLLTLPLDATVFPLIPNPIIAHANGEVTAEEEALEEEEKRLFQCFSFEDYAWRSYHERFFFKDPLDKYRI